MEDEKRIVFNSSVGNIKIYNELAHFQNSLFDKNYLNPLLAYKLTPRQIYMDLNFKNPVCPVNNAFPSLICVPRGHFDKKIKEQSENVVKLNMFNNIHKYYVKPTKKYTMRELFDEWNSKEKIGIKTKKKYNEIQGDIKYEEKDLILTTTFLKKTTDSIIFGQHPIEEGYEIPEDDKTLLLFHFKFVEKLNIQHNDLGASMDIDGEKYYMLMPLNNIHNSRKIEVSLENQGLLFETPKILQIKCENIKAYPFNESFTKSIGVVNLKENNGSSSFHHTFKGNQFYPVESKLNETWEISIADEHGSILELYEGTPTILEISAIPIQGKMENAINVTCNSEISKFHPKNSPTDFTTVLNTPLFLDRDWRVALSSITFKNNFKFDSNFVFQFSYTQFDKRGRAIIKRNNIKIDENVQTVREIYEIFKKILKKHNPQNDEDEIHESEESQPENILDNEITINVKKRDRSTAKVGNVDLSEDGIMTILFKRATVLKLTPHLAMILGVNNNPFERNIENYNQESVTIEVGLGQNSNNQSTGGVYIASIPINFNFNLKQKFMFVEMNVIKNVCIGNGNAKIVKIIPLSLESFGQYVTTDFDNLDYHPLENHHLHNIEFKLLSQSGSVMKSHDEKDYNNTWIQLIFKKMTKNDEDERDLKRARLYW